MSAELSDARPASWFAWALALGRVVMGAFFLMEAVHQLTSGWIGGSGLEGKLTKALDTAIPPYDRLIEHVFLHIDQPLTVLVIAGEIAAGAALVLGLLTRFTSLVAMVMNANFLLMNGLHANSGGVDIAFILGEIILLLFASRQALSADTFLARRGLSGPLMSASIARTRA